MTNEDLNAWRQRLSLTYKAAAAELGISERSVYGYAKDMPIPRYIELACCELERRWNEKPIQPSNFTVDLASHVIMHRPTGALWAIGVNDQLLVQSFGKLEPHIMPRFTEFARQALVAARNLGSINPPQFQRHVY